MANEKKDGHDYHECTIVKPMNWHLKEDSERFFEDANCSIPLMPGTAIMNEAMAAFIIQRSDFEKEIGTQVESGCGDDVCECVPYEASTDPMYGTATDLGSGIEGTIIRKLDITGIDAWVKFGYFINYEVITGLCAPKQ